MPPSLPAASIALSVAKEIPVWEIVFNLKSKNSSAPSARLLGRRKVNSHLWTIGHKAFYPAHWLLAWKEKAATEESSRILRSGVPLAAIVVIILPFAGWLQLITCPQMWGNLNLEFVNSSVVFWQEGGFWQTVSGNKLSLQGSEPCCNCWIVFMPSHPLFREAAVQPAVVLWNRNIV